MPRAVAVDPPGHGSSPHLAWDDYSLANLAMLANELVREMRADTFVGHSWGANVGAGLGAGYPGSLRALVLVDGGFVPGVPAPRKSLLAFTQEAASEHDSWEAAFTELRGEFGGRWPRHAEAVAREAFLEEDGRVRERAPVEARAAVFGSLAEQDPVACAARIRDAHLRTLLIVSGRTPHLDVRRREWERFISAGSPAIELHLDEHVGHHLLMEASDEYVPLIAEWLRDARIG